MSIFRSRIVLSVALVLLLVGLSFTAALAAENEEPILIGATKSLSGKYAKNGQMAVNAIHMWQDEVNAEGGLLGRPVKVKVYDDQSDPSRAVGLYQKLITQNHADLIIGPYSSGITFPTTVIAEKYKKIFGVTGNSPQIYNRGLDYVFSSSRGLTPTYSRGAFTYWDTLPKETRPKKIGFLYEDTLFPKGIVNGAKKFAERRDMEVVAELKYEKATTNYRPLVSKVQDAGATMIVTGTYFPDSVGILRAMKELDYSPKLVWMSVGPTMPDFGESLGKAAIGVLGGTHWSPKVKTPGSEKFTEKYKERFGDIPDYHPARPYSWLKVLEKAIRETGTLDDTKLKNYIASHEFTTILGKRNWGELEGEKWIQANPQMFQLQWQPTENGEGVDTQIIYPGEFKSSDPIYPFPSWDAEVRK